MKMMMAKRCLGVAAAMLWGLVAAPSSCASNEQSITGRVSCVGGGPLPYGNVAVLGTKLGAITGKDGLFVIHGVPTGTYSVKCSYIGFQTSTKLLTVSPGASTDVEFELKLVREVLTCTLRVESGRVGTSKWECELDAPNVISNGCFGGLGSERLRSQEDQPGQPLPQFALAQNHPNPCNPSTEIAFELAHRTRARLRIYDPAGRLVRFLVNETLDPGPQAISWDGRNDRGRAVSSGVYFYRLEAADFVETRQLVVLR